MKAKILLILLTGSLTMQAQTNHSWGLFPTIDHSGQLSEKWSYYTYLFASFKPYTNEIFGVESKSRITSFYSEVGANYKLSNKLTATASYVYERQNPFEDYYRNENRLFQQLALINPVREWFNLKLRIRFDERFIQDPVTKQANFTHRIRLLTGFSKDLTENLYVFGYSELFLNTSSNFAYNENWSALQIGRELNASNKIETGLLYIGWINDNKGNWLHQYYLQLTWVSKLNFVKHKNDIK
jgi:hypothetical protein